MKTKEFILMRSETERAVANAIASRIRRILYDTFGHDSADAPAYRPKADVIPGLLGQDCPFGIRIKSIHTDGDDFSVTWAWTLCEDAVFHEATRRNGSVPAAVLEAALRCVNVAHAMAVARGFAAIADGKTGDSAFRSFSDEEGVMVLANVTDGVIEPYSSFLEQACKRAGVKLPEAPYFPVAGKGVQAFVVLEEGKDASLFPFVWSVDTGLVDTRTGGAVGNETEEDGE